MCLLTEFLYLPFRLIQLHVLQICLILNGGMCIKYGDSECVLVVGIHLIGCIVFVDGGCTLLNREAPPWLVFWWLSHQCRLWDPAACFFLEWAAWSRNPLCLLGILDSAFQSVLAGVSQRGAGICLGMFSYSSFCLIYVNCHTCSIDSSAWPIHDLPRPSLLPFVSFTALWSGLWGFSWPVPLFVWFASVGDLA